mgnify:CR=1 FL=1
MILIVDSGATKSDWIALNENGTAKKNFEAFSNSSKKNILWWIKSAKRDATRQQRIEKTVRLAEENVKANH